MENAGASVEGAAGSQAEGTEGQSVAGGADADQGQQEGEEAAQGETEGAEGQAEGDVEVVEKDGKHFIPKERFDQIYGKMKEFESFFETIQSDPDARQKFVESLSGGQGESSVEKPPENNSAPSAVRSYLADNPVFKASPEHQALFGGLVDALGSDFESHLASHYMTKAEIQKMIAPLKGYIGESETSRFFEKNPQAKAYQTKIVEIMRQHPTLSIHQASKLASDTDNKVRAAGVLKAKQQQEKLNKTPITGKTNSGGGEVKKPLPGGNQGIAEGVQRAFAKLGIKD